jgi:hypothetical protein
MAVAEELHACEYGGIDVVVLELARVTSAPTHTLEPPLMVPGSVRGYTVFTTVAVIEPQLLVTV